MDFLDSWLQEGSAFLWGYVLLFCLLGTHLYLTVILRAPQRHLWTSLKLYFKKEDGQKGDISQFSSLMVSLAANIGTGNVIGVAGAVGIGGPGAIFWCWLTGVLGMSTRYAEGLLAIKYRVRDSRGKIVGGPMYALSRGLKCPWLAAAFAVLTAIAAFGIGNVTQGNSAAARMYETFGVPSWATGAVLTLLVAVVLLGGLKSIARLCSALVPAMALVYIAGCIYILCVQSSYIGPAIETIFNQAFTTSGMTGGFFGSAMLVAMRAGVSRGLFSNEAGMGSSPIVSAPARTPNPVQQALVASTGPFWDTVVICTLTGLVITTSILAHPDISSSDGERLTLLAFSKIEGIGSPLLTISLLTFVISTLLGWSYFGEKALEYLGGAKMIRPYRVVWVIAVYLGCTTKSSLVWSFADCANALMALPNLICLVGLSGVLMAETRRYLWSGQLQAIDPTPIPLWHHGEQADAQALHASEERPS